MKLIPVALGLVLVVGCGERQSTPSSTNTNTTASAPAATAGGYLGSLGNAQNKAVKTVDTTSLTQAVQLFNVDHGRNPKDLDELVKEKYVPALPAVPYGMKLQYDPASGAVTVVKQ